jgi:hypothetical protein
VEHRNEIRDEVRDEHPQPFVFKIQQLSISLHFRMLSEPEKQLMETLWQEAGVFDFIADTNQYLKSYFKPQMPDVMRLREVFDQKGFPTGITAAQRHFQDMVEACPLLRSANVGRTIEKIRHMAVVYERKNGHKPTMQQLIDSSQKGLVRKEQLPELEQQQGVDLAKTFGWLLAGLKNQARPPAPRMKRARVIEELDDEEEEPRVRSRRPSKASVGEEPPKDE